MNRQSCIYEGKLLHRRASPVEHEFTYSLFLMYLDLQELPRLFEGRWLWSCERPAPARFRREDHLGPPHLPLDQCVRRLIRSRTGRSPEGAIRLLTQLRYLGYGFNPVSFYFCFDADETLDTVVAEVHNTPWGERYCYVLGRPTLEPGGRLSCWTEKDFHVSPFMPMDLRYRWSFTPPAETLDIRMELHGSGRVFDAALVLERTELTGPALARVLVRYPLMSARVIAGIYFQALRLWLKGAPFHPHPDKASRSPEVSRS